VVAGKWRKRPEKVPPGCDSNAESGFLCPHTTATVTSGHKNGSVRMAPDYADLLAA
jgi:hypothetical protein